MAFFWHFLRFSEPIAAPRWLPAAAGRLPLVPGHSEAVCSQVGISLPSFSVFFFCCFLLFWTRFRTHFRPFLAGFGVRQCRSAAISRAQVRAGGRVSGRLGSTGNLHPGVVQPDHPPCSLCSGGGDSVGYPKMVSRSSSRSLPRVPQPIFTSYHGAHMPAGHRGRPPPWSCNTFGTMKLEGGGGQQRSLLVIATLKPQYSRS